MHFSTALFLLSGALMVAASPAPLPTPAPLVPDKVKRFATNIMPASKGYSALSAAKTIAAGASFDGGLYKYDRGGDAEGGDKDAVFILQSGATLKNVIIGKNQIEGVHCLGPCTVQNVWWEDVCEDALSIKQTSGTSYVVGGGAFHASDKIVQHNGGGTVNIKDFYAEDFGKVYRSCGNCGTMYKRTVVITGLWAKSGKLIAGVNSNYGDTATISGTCASSVSTICSWYEGNNSGAEPPKLGSGISAYCKYATTGVDDCP